MKKKLNCILLVDDSESDNFFHTRIIKKSGCADKVATAENGLEALAYLETKEEGEYPSPDLIFLDINMPKMNGWEFLEAYKELEIAKQASVVLVMLTTSINPDDKGKAEGIQATKSFISKPLTEAKLYSLLEKYFPEKF